MFSLPEDTDSTKILLQPMASGPTTSWQIDGETVEPVGDFILGAPKSLQMVITAMKLKDVYSLEGNLCKRCLLLGRKLMTDLDSILKSRDINLSTKSWTIKKAFVVGLQKIWTMKKAEH